MIDLFNAIESIINQIISPLNWAMLFLIIGGGIYLTIISKVNPLLRIVDGFKLMIRKDPNSIGISRFQAIKT
jgi:Na+/alanine symporter